MKVVLDPPYHLVLQGVLDAPFVSNTFECLAYYGMAIQFNVTVTSVANVKGAFKIQHSHDNVGWVDSTIFPAIWGVDINAFSTFDSTTQGMIPWKYLRIIWTPTAGTGFFDAAIMGVRV